MQPNDTEKRARQRSPNYPAVSLPEAIERVRALYDADKRAGAPIDAALRHIGFNSRNGKALAVLSALRKFGLVEDSGGRIAPTQRAVTILAYPDGDQRKLDAVRESALSPEIYRSLHDRYSPNGYLPSDSTLKAELEAEMGFNPSAISAFAKDFKETLAYSGLLDINTLRLFQDSKRPSGLPMSTNSETEITEIVLDSEGKSSMTPLRAQSIGRVPRNDPPDAGWGQEMLQFKIGEDAEAKVQLRGRITQEAIEKLIQHLELSKDTYPLGRKTPSGAGQ